MIAVVSHVTSMWLNICWWCKTVSVCDAESAPAAQNLPANQWKTNVEAPFKLTDQKAQMIWSCHILRAAATAAAAFTNLRLRYARLNHWNLPHSPSVFNPSTICMCLNTWQKWAITAFMHFPEIHRWKFWSTTYTFTSFPFSQLGPSNCSDGLSGNPEPHRSFSLISRWSRHANRKLRKGRTGIPILIIKQLHFTIKAGHIKQGRGYNREQTSVFTYRPLNECGRAAQTEYNPYPTIVALKQTLRCSKSLVPWKLRFYAATLVIKVKDI